MASHLMINSILNNASVKDRECLQDCLTDYFADDVEEETSDCNSELGDTDYSSGDEFDMKRMSSTELITDRMKTATDFVLDDRNAELEKARKFSCTCQHNKGGPCYSLFSPEEMVDRRLDMAAMTPRDQMLVLLGKVSACIVMSEMTCAAKKATSASKKRDHQRTVYSLEGHKICRSTFRFLHGLSQDRLTGILKWYRENGLKPKEKQSGGLSQNSRAFKLEDYQRAVQFIVNYAEDHALDLPGRVPGFKKTDVKLLPSSETKARVFQAYATAMEQSGFRCMSEAVFRKTWLSLLPDIITARPMTDLCWTCQQNNTLIYRCANLSEEDKSTRLQQQEQHLYVVQVERSLYNKMIQQCKDTCKKLKITKLEMSAPCSRDITMHYSFDFAQQVHLPSNPLQPGPMYFMVPRKIGLFGIYCEGVPQQVNFVIDEAHLISKGSNAVISYLDFFLCNFAVGECHLQLHCDNCTGQNKNNFLLWYLSWRVLTGRHKTVSLNFIVAGHTKFAPDACFGLLKRAFRRHAVSSLQELAEVVEGSAHLNTAQLVGSEDGTSFVPVGDWQVHLSKYFKQLPGIKKYHHFRFDAATPGVVHAKLTPESEEDEFVLLKTQPDQLPQCPPNGIPPPGLSLQRQWYLFQNIRQFVKEGLQDTLCPQPVRADMSEVPSLPPAEVKTTQSSPVVACGEQPARGRSGVGRVGRSAASAAEVKTTQSSPVVACGEQPARGRSGVGRGGRSAARGRAPRGRKAAAKNV